MSAKAPARPALTLTNLVAATFTPFRADGSVHLARIKPVIDRVLAQGVSGLYVCGSTGEGPLLTTEERKAVALAHVKAARGRVPVVIQVGHNSPMDARALAAHAQQIGADAISATPPGYFKPDTLEDLIKVLAQIAGGAPKLPF
ncbi:MAG: N-acetylneuraminate lyase [Verrucomicrobiota bacterium]|jgi:N-acetylneuraminate lyase